MILAVSVQAKSHKNNVLRLVNFCICVQIFLSLSEIYQITFLHLKFYDISYAKFGQNLFAFFLHSTVGGFIVRVVS